jgi:hypothetical protein
MLDNRRADPPASGEGSARFTARAAFRFNERSFCTQNARRSDVAQPPGESAR